jgi:CubicO group peptidase (beta-lactamase class C family)
MQVTRLGWGTLLWSVVLLFPRFDVSAQVQAPAAPPGPEQLASKVEEYMAARVQHDHFSGSILIAKGGKVLYCQGYGMANLEHDVPNTPQTKFRLGSITKQFTAMAILILQERGKLNVHDKVKQHFADAPKAWDEITIEHLLTHTSGIPNYTESLEFLRTLPVRVSLKELIAKFKDRPLDFKPGAKFKYSNSGYIVLGQIIETVSGKNYPSFMKEAIFGPLDMKDTGYDNATALIKNRASGYTRRLGIVLTNCDYIDMSIPHDAGALYSTVLDLLKWDQALYSDKLLPRKSLEAMFTPHKDNYGYGWIIDKKYGAIRYSHGGGIMGFVTTIERYPDDRLLVVALSNLETAPVFATGSDLAAIARGEKYTMPGTAAAKKVAGKAAAKAKAGSQP